MYTYTHISSRHRTYYICLDGYCSTVQGLLDWFEVDLGFTELLFIQIVLCVLCVFVLIARTTFRSEQTLEKVLVYQTSWHAANLLQQICGIH